MRRWGQELGSARCSRAPIGWLPGRCGMPPSMGSTRTSMAGRRHRSRRRWTTSLPEWLRRASGGTRSSSTLGRREPGRSQRQGAIDLGDAGSVGVEHGARFLFATWWYRARVVNGKAADERFDSSPRSLAALPDVLRRRVTHPGSLTGSAEWVRGASRAARGSVVHIPVMSSFDRIFAWRHASEDLRRAS